MDAGHAEEEDAGSCGAESYLGARAAAALAELRVRAARDCAWAMQRPNGTVRAAT